ncbi:MAG: hypothetical protein ABS81_04190 [Pseudonocardia sp. SCN 72-86]|nr:MAG: hypothetical protein ABS81_04190 [Pseudonocardia sp. SCN 72-86]
MIEHTVSFNLKHATGSPGEQDFLRSLRVFADIPGVQDFKVNRQVSSKGPFAFQITMWFDTQAALDAYDASKVHVDFVNERWIPEVSEHQTLDFVEI